jgi:hypothetical protein
MARGRLVLSVLALAVVLAGAWLSFGPPRFTLVNAGLRLDYPPARAAAAFAAAAGAGLAAATVRRRGPRLLAGAVGLALALWAGELLAYRLEADAQALSVHTLGRRLGIPWREVTHVQAGSRLVVVTGGADAQIQVATDGFTAQQRATIERTIARRVGEAQGRMPAPPER